MPNVEKVVNLDVHVNGEKRNMRFRVETFDWSPAGKTTGDQVEMLRNQIANYDSRWKLYHIGTPVDDKIPVTFRYES